MSLLEADLKYIWHPAQQMKDAEVFPPVVIDHGNGYQTLYAHMSAQAVHVGDVVEQGQVIGYVGNTGNSFGNHCHFEMYYNERLFSARDVFPDMPEWNR